MNSLRSVCVLFPRVRGPRRAISGFLSLALISTALSLFSPAAQATSMTWTDPGAEKIGWTYSADSYDDDSPIRFHPTGIAFGNGIFVAISDNYQINTAIETSPDGNIWTPRVADTSTQWNTIAFGGGIFVALGINENWDASVGMKSSDGINWTPITVADTNVNWKKLAYGGGRFVAVGSPNTGNPTSLTMYSSDGSNWSLGTGENGQYWNAVTYGDGKFVAVGRNGSGLQQQDAITSSDGGATWTTSGSTSEIEWSGIAFGNHTFLAVSQGTIMTSTDGSTWLETNNNVRNYSYDAWYSVIYGANKFVLIGDDGQNSGRIAVSSDAIHWEYQKIGIGRYWRAAAFGNNRLVIVDGYNGGKLYSNLQYSIPSYELRISSLDNYTNQQNTELCESCTVNVYARLSRSDGGILDTLTAVSLSTTGTTVRINSTNPQNVDSGGTASFEIQGNGNGAGGNVALHFQATTISSAQGNISFHITPSDQSPEISTSNSNGGVILTVDPNQTSLPSFWDAGIKINQSSDPSSCAVDVSQPIVFYPDGGEPYTIQDPLNPYEMTYYYDSYSDAWLFNAYRETNQIPRRMLLPGLQNGCRYDLSVSGYRQGYMTPITQISFTYSTPTLLPPIFTLSSISETVTAGTAINGYQLASTGGTIASYTISPTPSNGTLAFNTSTGLLTGTPTTSGATSFTITGHNATVPDLSRRFTLTVQGGSNPSNNNSPGGVRVETEIERQARIAKARTSLILKIQDKKSITSSDLIGSDLPIRSEAILARANNVLLHLQDELETQTISIDVITTILLKETVVEQLSNPVGQVPLRTYDLVAAGLLDSKNPNKTLILVRLKKLPKDSIETVEKVQLSIKKLEADIQIRKDRLAKLAKRS